MFIRRLRLDGLLSFAPGSPEFELRPLNVLIGPNGSGKSNLIEALYLLSSTPPDLVMAVRKCWWMPPSGCNSLSRHIQMLLCPRCPINLMPLWAASGQVPARNCVAWIRPSSPVGWKTTSLQTYGGWESLEPTNEEHWPSRITKSPHLELCNQPRAAIRQSHEGLPSWGRLGISHPPWFRYIFGTDYPASLSMSEDAPWVSGHR